MPRREKIISIASYNGGEYEQFQENITRVRYMKYFKGTKPQFKERESTGIFLGSFLSLFIGVIGAPYLLRMGSHFSEKTISGFAMIMAASAVFLAIWGILKMREERQRTYRPVPDEEFDRYLAFDLKGLVARGRMLVTEKTPVLSDGEDSIEDAVPIILYSPEEYSSNVNLPMLSKAGDDGFIRASNLYVMIVFPTEKAMYINITYLNLLNGQARFDRIYACPYENVSDISFKKRKYEIITQSGEQKLKRVKSFLISSEVGDTRRVGVDVVDYDLMEEHNGKFNEEPAIEALRILREKADLDSDRLDT